MKIITNNDNNINNEDNDNNLQFDRNEITLHLQIMFFCIMLECI